MEEKKNEQISALDLSRVKVVEDLVIKPNHVLIKITDYGKSGLILPEHAKRESTVWEIVKVGANVTGYSIGQYVINVNFSGAEFMFKGDVRYILVDAYNLLLACNKDNYEQFD